MKMLPLAPLKGPMNQKEKQNIPHREQCANEAHFSLENFSQPLSMAPINWPRKLKKHIVRRGRCFSAIKLVFEDDPSTKQFKKDFDEVSSTLAKPLSVSIEQNLPQAATASVSKPKSKSKLTKIAPESQQVMSSSTISKAKLSNNPTNTDEKGSNSQFPIIPTDAKPKVRSIFDID